MKTMPGMDRLTLGELRAEDRLASEALKTHRKTCHDCARAKHNPYAFCDDGWDMAKRASRAAHELRSYKRASDLGQDKLW